MQGQQTATERVHQAVAGGLVGLAALDGEIGDIVGNINQKLVGLRADITNGTAHIGWLTRGSTDWKLV